jgi:hypothetical protein
MTDNTIVKRKITKKTQTMIDKQIIENKTLGDSKPTRTRERIHVLQKGQKCP